jgi:tetratricopeptide (TPR) repeat protein
MTSVQRMRTAAAIAQSALAASDAIPPMPTAALRLATEELAVLPPQWQAIGHCDGIGPWIDLAASVESKGLWSEAWELLSALADRLDAAAQHGDDPVQQQFRRAAVAFLCARRGRVARMSSRLDVAMAYQQEAARRARTIRHPAVMQDVLPNAWLGLCVSVVEVGNYPRAMRLARRVLHPEVPVIHQVQALVMMALCARKMGRLPEALRYLWRAFDLNTNPRIHTDVLASLGEIANSAGAWLASVRARLSLLAQPVQARVATPSLSGLLEIAAAQFTHHEAWQQLHETVRSSLWGRTWMQLTDDPSSLLDELIRLGNAVIENDSVNGALFVREKITPHDLVVLRIALARLLLAARRHAQAAAQLREASRSAEAARFNERTFQIDDLLTRAEQQTDTPPDSPNRTPTARRRPLSGVWERFEALPIDGDVIDSTEALAR